MDKELCSKRIDDVWDMIQNSEKAEDVKNVTPLMKEMLNYDIQLSDQVAKWEQHGAEMELEREKLKLEQERLAFEKQQHKESQLDNVITCSLKGAEIAVRVFTIIVAKKIFIDGSALSYAAVNNGQFDKMLAKEAVDGVKNILRLS